MRWKLGVHFFPSREGNLPLNRRQPDRLHLFVEREPLIQRLCNRLGSGRIACHGESDSRLHVCTQISRGQIQRLPEAVANRNLWV